MPAADQEIDTALRLVLQSVMRMPGQGVTSPHVIPTALVMVVRLRNLMSVISTLR